MSTELRIPNVGESIQEVQIGKWLKQDGDHVEEDENVVELETEKASLELPAPVAGVLKIVKQQGEAATIGETIALVDPSATGPRPAAPAASATPAAHSTAPTPAPPKPVTSSREAAEPARSAPSAEPTRAEPTRAEPTRAEPTRAEPTRAEPTRTERAAPHATPSARRALREHDLSPEEVIPSGRQLRRQDVERHVEKLAQPAAQRDQGTDQEEKNGAPPAAPKLPGKKSPSEVVVGESEEIVPMTFIRRKIAERLVQAQKTAALLTTYNEIDMTAVLEFRKEFGERFREKHGVKLGFMSFFVKAVVEALKEVPALNAEIRDNNIVYRHRYDIGVAIGSEHGLVVPVLRNADRMTFAEIEQGIADFATRASKRKLEPTELIGGTFTISNGGIYGSLLSTPIVNPPQSGVLGMHAIQDRPVARDKQVVILPMMYIALTYDHRIVDGREAVTWLRRVKESVEQPSRLLVQV